MIPIYYSYPQICLTPTRQFFLPRRGPLPPPPAHPRRCEDASVPPMHYVLLSPCTFLLERTKWEGIKPFPSIIQ
jgi:hypothetical protein